MDRRGRKLNRAALALFLLTALAGCRSPAPASGPAEIAWTAEGSEQHYLLTTEPESCDFAGGDVSDASPSARRGELMFSSPFLLGGQAAKAGLSCASCHVNGRGNPAFVFAGLSGAPGTADVTHGFFGPERDDGLLNPVKIPDLSLSADRKLDRSDPLKMVDFLRSQIAEEFEGTPPSDSMLRDLGAYLSGLSETACPPDRRVALRSSADLHDAADAYRASISPVLAPVPDGEGYARAARHALGRIHARYPRASDADLRAALERISRAIADKGSPEQILAEMEALRMPLMAAETRSLYAENVLSVWMSD